MSVARIRDRRAEYRRLSCCRQACLNAKALVVLSQEAEPLLPSPQAEDTAVNGASVKSAIVRGHAVYYRLNREAASAQFDALSEGKGQQYLKI